MAKYILFDTETTGTGETDRIIQVGAMILDSKGNVEKYDELCSTDVTIAIEAMEVHGITPDKIENKPKFIETKFYNTLQQLNNSENFLIAHNMPFDLGMIKKEGFENQTKLIDTLRCAKHLFKDSPYHRLQYFRYSMDLFKDEQAEANKHDITIKAHDAIGDVLVMKLFLSKLVAKVREVYPGVNPMEKLHELTKTPVMIETFKFGKYKDQKIEEVCDKDMQYINWMMDKMDLDEDMQYTLDKIMGHI
ncbi:MAG: 3'-5' exonuclease [Campylobacteraceae bacterium]|jgi:DNA polymerase-3 subunit epsilon/exodeoxyribonuclease X|nr:3'-5' exonuclease [Campylobacteraceae bacterium]MBT3881840.1 3'-5' exonuclease [Campylobacteraceae bacterium]MBT4031118.1 3'-5' exonuclease [Campylobacteraceae bacterium]MBT4179393.1 3'-5' exonuclease [Campylobacteraceae bacterium]MBT4571808.1 3'-5' exonuclease [Campylobacteraceae bacterium]